MEELTSILEQATAGIAPDYFYLNLDGGDPIYRERVYCYELYHQMRMRWPAQTPFYLNGEVDKARHPKMIELRDRFPKPDLLVHRPGYMAGNFAVIEVKCERAGKAGIIKDLETLSFFVNEFGYQRAIYLIYGDAALSTLAQIQEVAQDMEGLGPIEYWAHEAPQSAAVFL
ncbi:methionyl-tRNA formyltransferase-like protein [Sphingomonas crusticola]|uniref:methionyl-tRNA formyltransferase-like protein n=1 Tax=Sphingomonas crusticola TaxID=1697973 RepID=UPI000E254849|nr:methionyl-tRNA formyltransferase-like protein [Sphingomonas crusticola]